MDHLSKKPHLIFWLSIPVILLVGFLYGDDIIDINIHDTYYVVAAKHFGYLLAQLFGLIGLGYWVIFKTRKPLVKWMYWAHTALTLGGIILIWGLTQFYSNSISDFDYNDRLTIVIIAILVLALLGQLLFFVNLLIGLINKKK